MSGSLVVRLNPAVVPAFQHGETVHAPPPPRAHHDAPAGRARNGGLRPTAALARGGRGMLGMRTTCRGRRRDFNVDCPCFKRVTEGSAPPFFVRGLGNDHAARLRIVFFDTLARWESRRPTTCEIGKCSHIEGSLGASLGPGLISQPKKKSCQCHVKNKSCKKNHVISVST